MSAPIKASREFVASFQVVCRHYGCPPEEIEEMKACARKDMAAAVESFAAMAAEIMPQGEGR